MVHAAQSKAVAADTVSLGFDAVTDMRTQGMSVDSGTSCDRPPVTAQCACSWVAVGTVVVASTQELERPFINTVVVGGALYITKLTLM